MFTVLVRNTPVAFMLAMLAMLSLLTLAVATPVPAQDTTGKATNGDPVQGQPVTEAVPRLGPEAARHLLSRTGFGGSPEQIEAASVLTTADAVERLLSEVRRRPLVPPPEWTRSPPEPQGRPRNDEQRMQRRKDRNRRGMELKQWWIQEMVSTDSPLTERMVLFWHNHFTSSLRKVKLPYLMYKQNELFRLHATGSFRALLEAVTLDPAMMVYLDTQSNKKGKPNENFARELLELFTLGEGHYTEQDIKEVARAFTGWRVQRNTGRVRHVKRQHDAGKKKFLGKTGNLGPQQIVKIILEQKQVSLHITRKLWREFINETPDASEVDRLAAVFRSHDYQIRPLLAALFQSPHFWKAENRGVLLKSPVDLIVGSRRLFGLQGVGERQMVQLSRALGQDLFDPPNVKGWPGGVNWISSHTLLLREQFLARAFRGMDPEKVRKMKKRRRQRVQARRAQLIDAWLDNLAETPQQQLARAQLVLLPIAPVLPPDPGRRPHEQFQDLVLDPTFQLK